MTRSQDVDAGFVIRKRQSRASWGAIARMAGCAEVDLRRHHDPAWKAEDGPHTRPVPPPLPRDVVRAALRGAGLTSDESLIIARLWLASGGRRTSQELAAGVAGGGAAQDACINAKRAALRLGITFAAGSAGFALTAEGVNRLSDLAGRPRGRP